MRYSTALLALAAPLLAAAAPFRRTAAPGDITVLQFADILEQFETAFYTQALSKFQDSDFIAAGFTSAQLAIEQFEVIATDESSHVTIIEDTLISIGSSAVTGCSFNLDSALTDVTTMAAVGRVVENLGVSAYLGAVHLMSDPVLLTAAATIVTVEARHQTILNIFSGATAIPQGFDLALSPAEVLAIAGPFISGCSVEGITANPTLTITNTGPVVVGTSLTFSASTLNGSTDGLFCQMLVGGAPFSISLPYSQCQVPAGINGPVVIFITSDDQPLANNIRDQATNGIIAGPTMAFIDSESQMISALVRTPAGGAAPPASTVTSTITPAQASAVVSSASASGSDATDAPSASPAPTGTSTASIAFPTGTAAASSSNNAQAFANRVTGPSVDGTVTVNGWTTPS